MVQQIDSLEQLTELSKNKIVIVDFYADWCGPCKMIKPKFESFSQTYTNIVAVKVDVDEAGDVAEKYDISAMPTFIVLKNGEKVDEMVGADTGKLEQLFQKYNA